MTEHVRSLEAHIDFALADATDFVRGDIGYDGVTGVMKLAHAAEGLGIDIEFHGPGPVVRQCIAATRNTNYYEMGLMAPGVTNISPPIYAADYEDGLDAVDERGHVPVPDGNGVGVPYDWDYISAHRSDYVEYKA